MIMDYNIEPGRKINGLFPVRRYLRRYKEVLLKKRGLLWKHIKEDIKLAIINLGRVKDTSQYPHEYLLLINTLMKEDGVMKKRTYMNGYDCIILSGYAAKVYKSGLEHGRRKRLKERSIWERLLLDEKVFHGLPVGYLAKVVINESSFAPPNEILFFKAGSNIRAKTKLMDSGIPEVSFEMHATPTEDIRHRVEFQSKIK
jgi:hypothetical protein